MVGYSHLKNKRVAVHSVIGNTSFTLKGWFTNETSSTVCLGDNKGQYDLIINKTNIFYIESDVEKVSTDVAFWS